MKTYLVFFFAKVSADLILTQHPSFSPSPYPTSYTPSQVPSRAPSHSPSQTPSHAPSHVPSQTPSHAPSQIPTSPILKNISTNISFVKTPYFDSINNLNKNKPINYKIFIWIIFGGIVLVFFCCIPLSLRTNTNSSITKPKKYTNIRTFYFFKYKRPPIKVTPIQMAIP